jgi:hypothetical protein
MEAPFVVAARRNSISDERIDSMSRWRRFANDEIEYSTKGVQFAP